MTNREEYVNGDPRLTVRERNWLLNHGAGQIELKWNLLEDLLAQARDELAEFKDVSPEPLASRRADP